MLAVAREIDAPGLAGKIIRDGIAQQTWREGGDIHVRLITVGDADPHGNPRGFSIELPEPVTLKSGETLVLNVEGAHDVRVHAEGEVTEVLNPAYPRARPRREPRPGLPGL